MPQRSPVIMIGLDAAEASLVQKLCSEGVLPHLQSLRAKGAFGLLNSEALVFSGGVWPTFYTSKRVPWHGIYHHKCWREENMRFERVDEEWLPETPFWETLDPRFRIAIVDVPMVARAARPLNGVYLSGWGSHDLIVKGHWPESLWEKLERRFGTPIMPREPEGPQTVESLLVLKRQLVGATEQMGRVSEFLFKQEPWDLFVTVFGATHRAGHYLWDLSQVETQGENREAVRELENGLVEVYRTCDAALGRLLARAPSDARILVFAVHGMGPNPGWSDLCPQILSQIQKGRTGSSSQAGLFYRLKMALPQEFARRIKRALPRALFSRLLSYYWSSAFDWSKTRFFPLQMDHAGYIRINLKGREPMGTVEPGEQYRQLREQLKEALASFHDLESGQPIVDRIYDLEEEGFQETPYQNRLPDLMVTWSPVSAIQSAGIRSEQYGEIRWNSNGRLPSARSGNHRGHGWCLAVGPGIRPQTMEQNHHITDLMPTVLEWLGTRPAGEVQGRPIGALC